MAKPFKSERAAQQQRLISDSLTALMLEKNYSEITVSTLCAHAGIPRRTFYYYFESIEEVLDHLLEVLLNECNLETMFFPGSEKEKLEEGFARFFRYWQQVRRRELEALLRNDMGPELITHCLKWIRMEYSWDQLIDHHPHEIRTVGSLMGTTCVFYTLYVWFDGGCLQSPEQMAAYVTQLLTSPIYKAE